MLLNPHRDAFDRPHGTCWSHVKLKAPSFEGTQGSDCSRPLAQAQAPRQTPARPQQGRAPAPRSPAWGCTKLAGLATASQHGRGWKQFLFLVLHQLFSCAGTTAVGWTHVSLLCKITVGTTWLSPGCCVLPEKTPQVLHYPQLPSTPMAHLGGQIS